VNSQFVESRNIMNPAHVIKRIGEVGVVPVIRASSAQHAMDAVEAIEEGGIPIVEITLTIPNAIAVIREVVARCGSRILVGAGTVRNQEQAIACLDAGAQFLVSPGLSVPILHAARAAGKIAIPGALTPTEIMAAAEVGATVIKVFPCGSVGGPKYIKALRGPFPDLSFIPTGGVNAANAAEFLAAGAFAIGVGSDLIDSIALREGRKADVVRAVRAITEVMTTARKN
jgi:2-dehydro-3-deoxyphosphogluconate aldolase/(4S)-4-hydroxy-2-oxoglutarate aldolase